MHKVYEEFTDDLDVAALYADSLMNLTPWRMWDLKTGQPAPGARTVDAAAVLEKAFELPGALEHPGLLHLYTHLFEMSPTPEKALSKADGLRNLVPGAGHLVHMPSHLDVVVGHYRRAIASNADALVADDRYLEGKDLTEFYSAYRAHNYHSLIYAALFAGQYQVAMKYVDKMEASIPDEVLRIESPPMANWQETFHSVRPHVLIRFGRWQDILDLEFPQHQELYCVTTASIHYAKGIAFAATGKIAEAEEQRELYKAAVARVPPTRMDFPNPCSAVLAIGTAMLDGELEYRKQNYEVAFEHLRKAVELDDGLVFGEPWGWMVPSRHALAALLLEQGRVEEAATVYEQDLGVSKALPRAVQHPNNVWSLKGYHDCLLRLGRNAEADLLGHQLKLAIAVSDTEITSSCFCKASKSSSSCC